MDEESFKRLFLPLHPRLFRIAYALTENTQDAEDILQEAYCKLWDKREELSQIRNPEAFCVTLIRNLCLDFLRSRRHNRQQEITENIYVNSPDSPETDAIAKDEISQIEMLINQLPEKQRQVIRLRGFNDFSLEEIEKIMGLSSANVRVLLSRARKMIREQFEKIGCYE